MANDRRLGLTPRRGTVRGSLLLGALALAAGVAGAGTPAATRRTLQPDDFYRAVTVSDPRVSPHGHWVAYVVTANDRASDQPLSAIWMVSWDGRERLELTAPGAETSAPRWSPDGRYLAYLAQPPGAKSVQVMLLYRRGGNAVAVTHVDQEIDGYAWSPDGKRLVLSMEPVDPLGQGRPVVIDALHFKDDGLGYLGEGRTWHLFLFDVASRRLEPLTQGARVNDTDPVWSPDGRTIAFVRTREHGADRDGREAIELIDARPGARPRELIRPYAPNQQHLAWSPDGSRIAFTQGLALKYYAYMQDHLYEVPVAGGPARALAPGLDRAVMSYAFTPDGKGVEITVEDDRTEYPAMIDLANGRIHRLTSPGPYVVTSLVDAAGHTAVLYTDDHTLTGVYALDRGRLRPLSRQNAAFLAGLRLGRVEDVAFKSGGHGIHGEIVEPPGYVAGRRYPLLLWIHGGPNGQDEHSFVLDGYQFEPQMFAARGYVVLKVNYRGSSGRGIAFAKAIFADWGDKEVKDLLAGVDAVVRRGIADPQRLAIGGWSYGGILTDATIARTTRFKVAICGAGSADQLATFGSDEYVLQYLNELGAPWQNPALWIKVSYPFFHADRIHTPTLFMGGTKDFNVPIVGGEQMYESLRTLGVPARLVVYPDQHHVFTRPSFLKDMATRMIDWVERYDPAS